MGAINGSHLWVKVSAVACPYTLLNLKYSHTLLLGSPF